MMMQYLNEALETCETLLSDLPAAGAETAETGQWTAACQTVGNILTSMGFIEEAYPWRLMALDAAPNKVKFYAESGRVFSQCEDWDRAIYFCQRTLEADPEDVAVRCRLAKIYNQIGNYRAESQTLNMLLMLRPDQATAEGHYQLGQVLRRQGQAQAAVACYERAIEQESDFAPAYYALGEIWGQQGHWAQAAQLFEGLIEYCPDAAKAHYHLGRSYRQGGQFERAIACFRQALQLDSQLHWAYMGLANTLIQLQRWDDVIEICQGVIHFVEEFPWAYCFMGNALAHKGDLQQAAHCHQQAFALRGWSRCQERDYQFFQTWFCENIPLWESHLKALNEHIADRPAIRALSLGSSDEVSLFWLADQVLRKPTDRLLCLTPEMPGQLQENLAKLNLSESEATLAERPEKVLFKTGELQSQLAALTAGFKHRSQEPDGQIEGQFELIYIQSDRKQADYLQAIATQAWPLLKPEGLIIFKDYQWRHPSEPNQSSKVGIDAFIATVIDHIEVLHQAHQVIIKKEFRQEVKADA